MILPTTEKSKTIKVYDIENDIISYQGNVSEIYAVSYINGSVYLLVKSGTSKSMQILKGKNNTEKLNAFLKKNSFDVAYKFAKNEKYSEEVLSDIARYYGDFFYNKVFFEL